MGYFDDIKTQDNNDVFIGKKKIKGGYYQSKDFMYDENNILWG